jgi:TctA family transporter
MHGERVVARNQALCLSGSQAHNTTTVKFERSNWRIEDDLVDILWLTGALLYGILTGFLTGVSPAPGTTKSVLVALVQGGVLGTVLTVFKDVDVAGQFLFGFSLGFFAGLVPGVWFRLKYPDKTPKASL